MHTPDYPNNLETACFKFYRGYINQKELMAAIHEWYEERKDSEKIAILNSYEDELQKML
jgi:predicted phosphoadenosine phosphosulfate sulfurtransferase